MYEPLSDAEIADIEADIATLEQYKPPQDEVMAVLGARATLSQYRVHNLLATIKRTQGRNSEIDLLLAEWRDYRYTLSQQNQESLWERIADRLDNLASVPRSDK